MPGSQDTIVAVSTPPGRSARGLVRVSGPAARKVVCAWCGPGVELVPRRMVRVRVKLPPQAPHVRAGLLPALLTCFEGPRSFSGQDMAELQAPGNPALLDRLLHAAVAAGARLAEPGEFTLRAFLAGKLDLTQAEGIAATIAATGEAQLQAAALLRGGTLGRFAAEVVEALGQQLALVEAGIDFVDQEDVVPIGPAALARNLAAIAARLDELLRRSRSWGAIEALPWVVLAGAPSTGKSTLFNALLGRPRAVTSAAPGTTRDVLAEPLTLEAPDGRRVEVMLVDIAGLDTPAAALDRQAQAAARDALARAELALAVDDGRGGAGGFEVAAAALRVRTKADQLPLPLGEGRGEGSSPREVNVKTGGADSVRKDASAAATGVIHVSAVTGQGLAELRDAIARRVGARGVGLAGEMLALQPRHEAALRAAAAHLAAAGELLAPQLDGRALAQVELIAGELRAALDELAALGGAMTPDDVIGRVFATFCVGK